MVHVLAEPVVRGEKVDVPAFKTVPGMVDGGDGILAAVFRIIKELYLVFVDEIFKFLLQVADSDGNVGNAGFVALADLPLNHPLAEDLEKPLGRFKGKRHKA